MKKFAAVLILCILVVGCSGCVVVEDTEEVPVSESLKINTWMLKEELEGTGYFSYDNGPPNHRYDKGHYVTGHWIGDDGTEIYDVEEIFEYESLELNTPRILAPFGFDGYNLNIRIESDDVINVKAEIRGNDDIVIAYSPSSPDEVIPKDWVTSNNFTVVGSFTFNVLPIGKIIATDTRNGLLVQPHTLVGKEYYIDINTYTLDSRPRVTAQLKLTVIEDEHCPPPTGKGYIHGAGDDLSRFVRIELVKFGYSDTALHDEFERYDHLYN